MILGPQQNLYSDIRSIMLTASSSALTVGAHEVIAASSSNEGNKRKRDLFHGSCSLRLPVPRPLTPIMSVNKLQSATVSVGNKNMNIPDKLPQMKFICRAALEFAFLQSPYPSRADRELLAQDCKMTYKQVTIWFQNCRDRRRDDKVAHQGPSSIEELRRLFRELLGTRTGSKKATCNLLPEAASVDSSPILVKQDSEQTSKILPEKSFEFKDDISRSERSCDQATDKASRLRSSRSLFEFPKPQWRRKRVISRPTLQGEKGPEPADIEEVASTLNKLQVLWDRNDSESRCGTASDYQQISLPLASARTSARRSEMSCDSTLGSLSAKHAQLTKPANHSTERSPSPDYSDGKLSKLPFNLKPGRKTRPLPRRCGSVEPSPSLNCLDWKSTNGNVIIRH